jgi:hypothetical protein
MVRIKGPTCRYSQVVVISMLATYGDTLRELAELGKLHQLRFGMHMQALWCEKHLVSSLN